MLSSVEKSILGANDAPLFNTHDCLTIFTALSFPDLPTATAAECKVLSPLIFYLIAQNLVENIAGHIFGLPMSISILYLEHLTLIQEIKYLYLQIISVFQKYLFYSDNLDLQCLLYRVAQFYSNCIIVILHLLLHSILHSTLRKVLSGDQDYLTLSKEHLYCSVYTPVIVLYLETTDSMFQFFLA